ncbi:MAG: hypothetical protein AAF682_04610 [Planctomycetota bacterium]
MDETEGEPFRGELDPHRGGAVLALGAGGLVLHAFGLACCPIFSAISIPLGAAAWVMANQDLAAMQRGDMDPSGEPQISAGKVMGIIAIGIGVVGLFLLFALTAVSFGFSVFG